MARMLYEIKDKTDGRDGTPVYLVFKGGGAHDCIQSVWGNEIAAQAEADRLEFESDQSWDAHFYWVEKYIILGESA